MCDVVQDCPGLHVDTLEIGKFICEDSLITDTICSNLVVVHTMEEQRQRFEED